MSEKKPIMSGRKVVRTRDVVALGSSGFTGGFTMALERYCEEWGGGRGRG